MYELRNLTVIGSIKESTIKLKKNKSLFTDDDQRKLWLCKLYFTHNFCVSLLNSCLQGSNLRSSIGLFIVFYLVYSVRNDHDNAMFIKHKIIMIIITSFLKVKMIWAMLFLSGYRSSGILRKVMYRTRRTF